ncbi:MAG TPA: ABC transporter substrate-binding protein [Candidatus Binatia bacterium]|jgi:putative ABC transport system substrate-binding protein
MNSNLKIQNLKFAVAAGALLFWLGTNAAAQQPAKLYKVGWLSARPALTGAQETIRNMLRDLGYVEGKNISFEFRFANNDVNRFPALARELIGLKVDVLLTPGTSGALALKNATKTIPIIFLDVTDPVAAGLVESLARPGGNITGFSSIEAVLSGKRLELLKETIPRLSRVAALWNSQDPSSEQQWKESQRAARELSLQLYSIEAGSADQYGHAFKAAAEAHSGALAVIAGPLAASNQRRLAELAAANRLPAIYPSETYVDSGGLMSYGADQAERYRRIAALVDKILKGTKPADVPVEQPTKFELVINLKATKKIGLTIPPNVLARADRVIK